MDLNGKCVLLGVSGGIAAYKMANVASAPVSYTHLTLPTIA